MADKITCESRCGMLCSQCPDREEYDCEGCLNIKETYWGGTCEIKDCCESKNHEHCGQCKSFPCSVLLDISYDTDLGDDGERIMHLKHLADKAADTKSSFMTKIVLGNVTGICLGIIIGALQGATAAWIIAGIIIGNGIALMLHNNN